MTFIECQVSPDNVIGAFNPHNFENINILNFLQMMKSKFKKFK